MRDGKCSALGELTKMTRGTVQASLMDSMGPGFGAIHGGRGAEMWWVGFRVVNTLLRSVSTHESMGENLNGGKVAGLYLLWRRLDDEKSRSQVEADQDHW